MSQFLSDGAAVRWACRAGRVAAALSRATGRGGGGVIGGRVVLALAPGAPQALAAGRDISLVSATNGKTTTSALLAAALGTLGATAVNADGGNTPPGITTALANGRGDRVVLETDEGWIPWAVSRLAPARVLLLNLSRDQLSRHHEVGRLVATWRTALTDAPAVVANADDPATVWPALAARRAIWVAAGQSWTGDATTCPACGGRLWRREGDWGCSCGLKRPEPDWWLEGEELVSSSGRFPVRLAVPGAFNVANAAMAAAAAVDAGADPAAALAAMRSVGEVAGRYSSVDVDGHQARLLLAKNPAGWMELLTLVRDAGSGPLVLAFNSEGVDGRDPSWLYDVPFGDLRGREVVVIGRRATDLRVRLEMDDVDVRAVRGGLREALVGLPPGPVDVLANYTAFQDVRREISRGRQ